MKRAALGALLISLVAGSTAFAGTFIPVDNSHRRHEREHRQDHRRDNHHGHDRRHDRDNRHWDGRRDDHRWDRGRDNDRRWNDGRRDDHRWDNRRNDHHWDGRRYDRRWERGRWHWGAYHRPHGYVHRHWGRGDRLPHGYYASHYVIRDYRHCGLRHPPHGYHWVRVNHDAVLAVIATGVILDVAYNQFW
jgi:Ni/Co efflux regulator RcnB